MDDKLRATLSMARRIAKKARLKAFTLKHNGMEEFEAPLESDSIEDLGFQLDPELDTKGQILDATGDDDFELPAPEPPRAPKGPAARLRFLRSYLTHRTLRGRR